ITLRIISMCVYYLTILLLKNQFNYISYLFFFQAEDGIRDFHVTGVQTCALPIFDEVDAVYDALKASSNVASITMMSHFANAEKASHPLNLVQHERFLHACAVTEATINTSLETSAALLSSAMDMPHHASHWMRTGILIY